jgi:beta-glucosidase
MCILLIGTYFATTYSSMINIQLNISTTKVVKGEESDEEDTTYYKSNYSSDDALTAWQKALCEQIQGEGTVLVTNKNNALPVTASTTGVTCFGRSSADIIYGGTGSGQVDTSTAATMKSALTDAGFKVNTAMLDWYSSKVSALKADGKDRSVAGMWDAYESVGSVTRIAEIPVDEVKASGVSYTGYKDLAIVTIGRSGGEGSDLAVGDFVDGTAYFELQETEKELLTYVASQGFGKIVVLINSSNAMALNWVEDSQYNIDACLWIGGPGQYGMNAVAKILSGEINPSGRFVDTYSTSSLSAPAMANFGGYSYTNADASTGKVGGVEIDGYPGDRTADRYATHYLVEEESIYVGYKYYETRYEDSVLGQGNAKGSAGVYASTGNSWSYAAEVNYPFGYGLSYTTFKQTLVGTPSYDASTDEYTVKVKVENTGSVDGKCAVQVYGQQPYTTFDKTNGIEKASVQLVGFAKTATIKAGASTTVEVKVSRDEFKTYDSVVNKTYILEGGSDAKYYISVGDNAHDALNNILAAKGKTTTDGMTADGNAENVYTFTVNSTDTTSYAYSSTNRGYKITNQFDDADLNYYSEDGKALVTYLTRSDWQGTYPTSYATLTANTKIINGLQFNYTSDNTVEKVTTGSTSTKYSVVMMRGLDYDDPLWEDLLNQLSINDMAELVGHSGYGTVAIESVALPATSQQDGPQGIKGSYGGKQNVAYTSEPVMAATFSEEILYNVGLSMGEDALKLNQPGWYGPAMNIHRTPYSGRNFEYFSEDSFLSGMMAANEVGAAQSMGVVCYIKHFALNDQETYRQSVATFAQEQAIREIYLKPFQYAVEKGNATAVMTSFNRIGTRWAGAHKGLLTNVLRNEWGFNGVALTDAVMTNRNWMDVRIGLEAGNDSWLSSGDWLVSKIEDYAASDNKLLANLRESAHRFLYAYANSFVVNGLSSSDKVVSVMAGWEVALITVDVIIGVIGVASLGLAVTAYVLDYKKKKNA